MYFLGFGGGVREAQETNMTYLYQAHGITLPETAYSKKAEQGRA